MSNKKTENEEMLKVKSITDRLPNRSKTILIQAEIESGLHTKIKSKMDKVKKTKMVTWKSLIESSLQKWLEES